tara:strand:- start:440 stop:898 length:459 start_codon:yes stop_codon:yes gene_type:complete
MKDNLVIRGDLHVTKKNTDTSATEFYDFRNLVVDSGIEFMLFSMIDASRPSGMNGMAIGEGTTAVVAGDTALETELGRTTITTSTVNSATNSIEFQATFSAGVGTGALTEAGIFNSDSSGGTMLCRTVFPVINKLAADEVTISWVITLAIAV